MKVRKQFILLGILVITSMACSCEALNQLVDRLPLIGGNSTTAISTLESVQIPQIETQSPDDVPTLNSPQDTQNSDIEGIQSLNSYQSILTISLQGIDQNGMQVDENVEFNQQFTKVPQAIHFRSTMKNSNEDTKFSEYFKIGDYSYLLNSESDMNMLPCSIISRNSAGTALIGAMEIMTPETIFSDVEKGELTESDVVVNGIASDHYQVNKAFLNGTALNTQTAEIWVAQDGGYTVRFRGIGEGDAVSYLNGNEVNGKIAWMYDLTTINQVDKILLPQACLDALESTANNIPIPTNSIDLSTFGTITSFSSPDSPGMVSEYYKQLLPTLGFVQTDISEFESLAILVYSKDGKSYSFVISAGDTGGASVLITVK